MAEEKKELNYFPLLAASAPVFAAKAIIGDMPKGAIEHAVEQKALGSKQKALKLLRQGFKGRGAGRAIGAGLGILSAPLFLKGTSLLSSKDNKDRRRGYGLVAASTGALAASKGFFENALAARMQGKPIGAAALKGAMHAGIRAGYKIPLSLATAAGIAAGRSKSESDPRLKYVLPLAAGVGAGAVSRAVEEIGDLTITNRKMLLSRKGARRVGAAGLGGAAGGALGGLILAKAIDVIASKNKGKEKKAALEALTAATPFLKLLSTLGEGYGGSIAQHVATGAGYGYKKQKSFLGKVLPEGLLNKHERATNAHRARHIGFGIQEGLHGKSTTPWDVKLLNNAGYGIGGVSPESTAYRELGIKLGRALRDKTPDERERALRGFQQYIVSRPGMLKGMEGEVNPLTGPLLGGISMALGTRPFYAEGGKLKQLGVAALHKGSVRNVKGGLPTELGRLEKDPSWLKENWPHALSALPAAAGLIAFPAAAALTGGAAVLPSLGAISALPGAAGLLAGLPVTHLGISGGKNLVTSTPIFKKIVAQSTRKGIEYGAFPNSPFKRNLPLELLASPASTMMQRSLKPIVRSVRDEAIAKGVAKGTSAYKNFKDREQARKIISSYPKQVLLPVGAGVAAGALAMPKAKALYDESKKPAE